MLPFSIQCTMAPFLPLSLLLMATTTTTRNREFRFVPYGESFVSDENRPTISCDGRIPGGVSLELTHWTDNETPSEYYADTSTEMALKFASNAPPLFQDALVLNNHYDSDGVLSVWTCLHPKQAMQYSTLLKEGAEAGDFGEWSSDNGVKLDCAIQSFLVGSEEDAYDTVLKELPGLLQDFQDTGGESYKNLWKDGFEAAVQDWESIQDGSTTLGRGPGNMVIVKESGNHCISPYALDRGMKEANLSKGTTRVLECLSNDEESKFQYRYGMPGYGWVKRLVDRPVIPAIDASKLVQQLDSDNWSPSGSLSGICHTIGYIETPPNEMASLLHKLDDGCK